MPRYSVSATRRFTVDQTYPVFYQFFDGQPDSAKLNGGDFIVVYYNPGQGLGDPTNGAVIQRLNADGTADGAPLYFQDYASPAVAALTDGGYVVAFAERLGANHHILLQRYDAVGVAVGGIVTVSNPIGVFTDSMPEISPLAGGGWALTWQRQDTGSDSYDVYTRAYDSAGVAGVETLVSTLSGNDTDPVITPLADGSYAVLWTRDTGTPDRELRLWHNGVQSLINGAGADLDASVALLPDGRLIVAWTGDAGVQATFVAADGTPGIPFAVHSGRGPDIAVFPDGHFVVVWTAAANESNGGHTIEGQVYDATGNLVPDSFFREAVGGFQGNDEQLTITITGPDNFFLAWAVYGNPAQLKGAIYTFAEAYDFVGTPDNDSFTGGHGDDTAQGLGGNDTLNGGAGNDRLEGGTGDDTYYVDNQGDVVIEAAGAGNDIVYASASYTLTSGQEIERLSAENAAGTDPLDLRGNEFVQTITGNAGANTFYDGGGADTLVGLGGDDTYFVQSAGVQVVEAVGGGSDTVRSNVAFVLGAGQSVELLISLGGAAITGNELGQELRGGDNVNDVLDGDGGADLMIGYSGNDTYYVDNTGDQVIEAVNGGTADRVRTSITYQLNSGQEIEFLETTDAAGTAPLYLVGNAFRQTITGNAGDNIFNGAGGVDVLVGLGGNDTYYVDIAQTTVQEAAGGGNDALYTSVSYVLGSNVSVELLSANDYSATSALSLTGNNLAQAIAGNAGNNVINGGGGNDTLYGFGGNDTFYVDLAGVQVIENVGGGNDALYTSVSYILGPGQEIELLSANSYVATTALSLTGNNFAQILAGNAGNNVFNGGGGNDTIYGFGGDDTYYVDLAGVQVIENVGGGNDAVYSSVSYVLGAGQEIEMLSANDYSATSALSLTGNNFAQVIAGNAGNNIINGGGGNDTYYGFGGNDTFYIDVAGVQVVEYAGGGNDALYSSVSYTLAAGVEVETLSTNNHAATAAIDLTGNAIGQSVLGNAGANVLNGGLGNDLLGGFGGADTFVFNTALGAANVDTIADFVSGTDKVALDDAIFGGGIGTPGAFNANAFFAGSAAHDADDRIIYNSATGQLFYDADGNGSGAAVLFATLTGAPALAASDFQVI